MADEPKQSRMQDTIASVIDKLTDPLELAIRKICSARFLIAVGTTFFLYKISLIILAKDAAQASVIFTCFSTAWGTIIGFYFGASMQTPIEPKSEKKDG